MEKIKKISFKFSGPVGAADNELLEKLHQRFMSDGSFRSSVYACKYLCKRKQQEGMVWTYSELPSEDWHLASKLARRLYEFESALGVKL